MNNTDGNTYAINRHLAEREAYDDQQEALEAVDKLAEAEKRIIELESLAHDRFVRIEAQAERIAYEVYSGEQLEAQLAEAKADRDWFKSLWINVCKFGDVAIPRAYRIGLEDAAERMKLLAENTPAYVTIVELRDHLPKAIRAIPTPTDLVERVRRQEIK